MEILGHAASVFVFAGHIDDAIALYEKSLNFNVDPARIHHNLGYAYSQQCKFDKALEVLNKSIALRPDYALAHALIAQTYLSLGDFKKAWPEFSWHWKGQYQPGAWKDIDFKNKSILFTDVMGLGDSLQFMRYVKILKQKGAKTMLFTTLKAIKPLYARCSYLDKIIIAKEDETPKADFTSPLMALPMLFDHDETSIPANIPYLDADPKLVNFWHKKLAHDANFKVGIAWHSEHKSELEKPILSRKSISLKDTYSMLKIAGASFYSLQKFDGAEELNLLPADITITSFDKDFDESHGRFMDTAALIMNLDLVIAVDTAVAHLAGAMGKPVWLVVPYNADWRWMMNRSDSPWYPKMKIFRQAKPGDWSNVAQEMDKGAKVAGEEIKTFSLNS